MATESRKYLVNIKKLGDHFKSPKECVDTLYDEYRLESKISAGRIRITVYNDNQYDKLKRFLKKYGADKSYIEEVMGSQDYKLKKKSKTIKEEMTKNNIQNNMNTRKRLSLNEAYFDQTRNGVLTTTMEDVYDMLPSRIRNGKRVIVFLHNDLLNEFKNMFKNYKYEFGCAAFDQMAEYGIDKLLMENLKSTKYDVFVVTFNNEDVINGFELNPQLSRMYATYAIDTPETIEPTEIRYAEDYDNDADEQIQESLSYRRKASLNEAKASLNKRPSLNEGWLDEEDDEDAEEPEEDDVAEPEVDADHQFVDELVDKYDIEDQPTVEDFEDMILEIKEYVDDLDPDNFDGKLFCDLVGYLCRDKFGVFISEDPEFESIKYLFRGTLQESIEARDARRNALNEAKKEDGKPAEKPAKSEFAGKSIDGKKLRDYKLLELGDLLKEKREALKEAKAAVRKEKDEKKAAKLQKNVEKIQAEIEMIQNEIKFRKKNKMNESSVRSQFNKYAKIFESEDISEDDDKDGDNAEGDKDDNKPENEEPKDEEPKDDNKEENDDKDDDKDDDNEEVPMTAVLVKVAKSDVEKAKKQMIDAGVEEDDIDEVEGDEDSDEVEIKVDANSIMALKDWLKEKGVDLEEKLGGEIVAPEDNGEEDNDENKEGDGQGDEEPDLDNLSFDDIFGADEGGDNGEDNK